MNGTRQPRFFHMAVDYAREIGFAGQFLIEPKPKEPTKHQYDSDVAAVLNFLGTYDLLEHFKVNVEANHATLAGHSFEHELLTAFTGPESWGALMSTGETCCLAGIPTSSPPTFTRPPAPCWLCLDKAGWEAAG